MSDDVDVLDEVEHRPPIAHVTEDDFDRAQRVCRKRVQPTPRGQRVVLDEGPDVVSLVYEQFDEMDKRAKEEALASVRFAEKSEEPPLEDLYKYTYLNGVEVDVSAMKPCPSAGTGGKRERAADTAASGKEA